MYLGYFINKIFYKNHEIYNIESIYEDIVKMSRNSILYRKGGVPDSLDGRYELLILHSHLIISRLIKVGSEGKKISQRLINILVEDFDNSLRELGVGDLSVGKKVKKMMEGYYGRAEVYNKTFEYELEAFKALKRNLYGTASPSDKQIKYMWSYIINFKKYLDSLSDKELFSNLSKMSKIKLL